MQIDRERENRNPYLLYTNIHKRKISTNKEIKHLAALPDEVKQIITEAFTLMAARTWITRNASCLGGIYKINFKPILSQMHTSLSKKRLNQKASQENTADEAIDSK